MLLSSMAGSSLGSNESAIVGHSNGMTKKFILFFLSAFVFLLRLLYTSSMINLFNLLYYLYLVCILFGMPSLHPFTFLMIFF